MHSVNRSLPRDGTTPSSRRHDPEQTRTDILAVATEEFSAFGLAGARVDAIAARTRTTKRMIYYYFGSKEALYREVLDKAYQGIRLFEEAMISARQPALQAMQTMVELTFDYHDEHPGFVRLVGMENLQPGRQIEQATAMPTRNSTVIRMLKGILASGVESGYFRDGIDPIDLHMLISSFCFHRISNRYTFGTLFGRDPLAPRYRETQREMLVDAVMRYVCEPSRIDDIWPARPASVGTTTP
jgi:AcrR family transcriptional regulator